MLKKRFYNAVEVRKWLASANPGDVVEYHRGVTAFYLDADVRKVLLREAGVAVGRYTSFDGSPPTLALFQKRMGDKDFSYRAMVLTPELAKKLHGLSDEMCAA